MSTYFFELAISVNGISKGNDEGNNFLQLVKKCPKVAPNVIFIFFKTKNPYSKQNEVQNLFQKELVFIMLKVFLF
jgi:hypothetical protein